MSTSFPPIDFHEIAGSFFDENLPIEFKAYFHHLKDEGFKAMS